MAGCYSSCLLPTNLSVTKILKQHIAHWQHYIAKSEKKRFFLARSANRSVKVMSNNNLHTPLLNTDHTDGWQTTLNSVHKKISAVCIAIQATHMTITVRHGSADTVVRAMNVFNGKRRFGGSDSSETL